MQLQLNKVPLKQSLHQLLLNKEPSNLFNYYFNNKEHPQQLYLTQQSTQATSMIFEPHRG